jgi:hypothetical protein
VCDGAVAGEPCTAEGTYCGGENCVDPCEFCYILTCENGEWEGLEAFPLPCDDDEFMCEYTEGTWEELSCGHYSCGNPPECAAVIPGCDCGANANFVSGEGCVADGSCGSEGEEAICTSSGGTWNVDGCGHSHCGASDDCIGVPGCTCGVDEVFDSIVGCVNDGSCCIDGSDCG